MQAGNIAFASSPHHPYHIPYHPPLPGQQDHELKKQYLTLLPPQQIIEICLSFDIHVPPYVKNTIWPPDINAAIAALQKTLPPAAEVPVAESSTKADGLPAMSSLGESLDPSLSSGQPSKPDEPQPPDKSTPTPGASSQPSSVPSEQPGTQAPQPQPPHQPPYPHQPYGYPHPQSAYPHAPYYQHPGYSYPPYQMPGYPHPPHPPGFPQPQPNPLFTNPPQQPQQPPDNFTQHASTDDLPSYEEMIAEALQDSEDIEGCAPKDLFNWMASRYPLQQNFRPSASQALQKAFRRGRFQKSSNGKYRINATWEGGNTSRRTTRRPQTQASSTPSGPPTASPFTHAPLVHHQQTTPAPPNVPNQPFQAPYAFPYGHPQSQPGYPGFPQQPPPQLPVPSTAPATGDGNRSSEGDAADAYEAAQNILKAINFGGLLELPGEDDATRKSTIPQTSTTEASTARPTPINVTAGTDPSTGHALESNSAGGTTNTLQSPSGDPRAELQAQLALLAAQLAELAQTDDEDVVSIPQPDQASSEPPLIHNGHPQVTAAAPSATDLPPAVAEPLPPVINHLQMEQEEEEDSDDDDMEEVI